MGRARGGYHYHEHGTQNHSHSHTHKEYRAPTDDSVELLKEMEKKALERVIDTVVIDNNIIKAKVVYMNPPMMEDRIRVITLFELNGKPYRIEEFIDSYDWEKVMNSSVNSYDAEKCRLETLYHFLSKAIAVELINQDINER